jgi:hypothetical protein
VVDTFLRHPAPFLLGLSLWQMAAMLMALALCLWLSGSHCWTICKPQVRGKAAVLSFLEGDAFSAAPCIQLLSFILWYVRQYGGNPAPIPIDGQLSKFTLLVMSYDARLTALEVCAVRLPALLTGASHCAHWLQGFVSHYSQCASVGEIVVVWNKGTPPDVTLDLPSEASWDAVPALQHCRVEQHARVPVATGASEAAGGAYKQHEQPL